MGMVVSLVYRNTGARSGTVDNVKLKCGRLGSDEIADLYPAYYVDSSQNYQFAGLPTPEVIRGGDQLTRTILFLSDKDWIKHHDFEVGEYKCSALASLNGENDPREFRDSDISFLIRKEDLVPLKATPSQGRIIFTHRMGVTAPIF